MSLATRCPSCGTVFRIVQDQLRVSEGWVRCGRCDDTFNALEGLFDLGAPSSTSQPGTLAGTSQPGALAGSSQAGALAGARALPPSAGGRRDPGASATHDDDIQGDTVVSMVGPGIDPYAAPEPDDGEHAPTQQMAAYGRTDRFGAADAGSKADRDGDVEAEVDDPMLADADGGDAEFGPSPIAAGSVHADDRFDVLLPPGDGSAAAGGIGFLDRADRAARWRQPRLRAALLVAAAALALLLAAQAARRWHADLAARWPQARPVLTALCAISGCRLGAPRRLDRLAVEASGFVRVDGSADPSTHRLSITLRNQDRAAIALPHVELTLTDARGEVAARRVLSARELGARQDAIGPGAELALQALLGTEGGLRPAGYSIDLFYP